MSATASIVTSIKGTVEALQHDYRLRSATAAVVCEISDRHSIHTMTAPLMRTDTAVFGLRVLTFDCCTCRSADGHLVRTGAQSESETLQNLSYTQSVVNKVAAMLVNGTQQCIDLATRL